MQKNSNECSEDFANRIQATIADKLGILKTNFTAYDKVMYHLHTQVNP